MTTYANLHDRALRILDDPAGTDYDDDIVYDSFTAAFDAILPWVPMFNEAILTAGSIGDVFQLPDDVYSVQAVQRVEDGYFLPRATIAPNTQRNVSLDIENNWIEYPSGYLSLHATLDEGGELKVYYLAEWPKPSTASDFTFVVTVPSYAHQGMVLYAASQMLLPTGTSTATIRQWNLRVDSGTPEDNPLELMSDVFLRRFHHEMKMMPPYIKATS